MSVESTSDIDTWDAAAAKTSFVFYEIRSPEPLDQWAGGYGWRTDGEVCELSIQHTVGDFEIVVTTRMPDPDAPSQQADERFVRYQQFVALMSQAFGYEELEALPLVLTFAEYALTITVGGSDVVFDGVEFRKNGVAAGWSGHATVDRLQLSVTTTPGPVAGMVLQPCATRSLRDHPSTVGE